MKSITHIALLVAVLLLAACSGSKKYFKAAERLEKQGLVNDAAEYYLESLQRSPTNVQARIKLKEVGQKHVSNLSSEFFRDYNTQQIETSLESFEKLKDFSKRAAALDVQFDYPKTYDDDYQQAVESFCLKNYNQALTLVSKKNYGQAVPFLTAIKKYNSNYKTAPQLEIVAVCEPLYQSAINNLENKNYSAALTQLTGINKKSDNYKDARDLLQLATDQQTKSFILFRPKASNNKAEQEIQDYLYNNFGQTAQQKLSTVKIINNTPFQTGNNAADLYNSSNVDLIQAIRKATGADYVYIYEVDNLKQSTAGPTKSAGVGYEEVQTRKSPTEVYTEYKPFDYNLVKSQRTFSYDFKYKLINAYSNQVVASQTQQMSSQDAVEYQEFLHAFTGQINNLYPYNPPQTSLVLQMQYNASKWRSAFSARNSLKSFEELKNDANNKTVTLFMNATATVK